VLSVGLFGVAGGSLIGLDTTNLAMLAGDSLIGPAAKFSVAFTLIYHYGAAFRHTLWDKYPDMLTNTDVRLTAFYLFGASGAVSAILACM